MLYPKITVVTPSYNQGFFLEKTIQSIINQDYQNLEYIIIDGGSTDDSVEIIKKYVKNITYWVSEKDKGQADALRKGFERATGDIYCWLNSDDTFDKGTLHKVAEWCNKLNGPFILTGNTRFINSQKVIWEAPISKDPQLTKLHYQAEDLLRCWKNSLAQPSTFWSKEVFYQIGNIDQSYFFAMDLEYWLRAIKKNIPIYFVPETYSNFLYHETSKSVSLEYRLWEDLDVLSNIYIEKETNRILFKRDLAIYKNSLFFLKQANEFATTNRYKSIALLFKGITNHWMSLFREFKIIRNTILKILYIRS